VNIVSHSAKGKIIAVSRSLNPSQLAKARVVITQRGNLQIGELVSVTVLAKGLSSTGKVNASIATSEPIARHPQWLIPSRALTQFKGLNWIFIANENGFVAHSVSILSASEDMSTIELPLSPGTRVAITGVASLRAMLQKDE